jgi:chromosome segregation ATPase
MDVDGRPYNTRGVRRNYAELAGLARRTTNPKVKVALQMVEQAPADEKDAAMDALAAALEAAGLGMGGRRRTRKQKGKKRGGDDHADTIARCREEVKELEEAVDRLRRQRRGGTRKHPRKTRKSRRGGVQPQRMTLMEKVKMLTKKRNDVDNDPNSTPEEKDAALKEWSDAYERLKSQLGRPDMSDPLFYDKLNDYLNRP